MKAGRPCHGASQISLWWGCGPWRHSFHPYSRARRLPHLCRFCSEEAKGKAGQAQSHKIHRIHATTRGHITEGRIPDPRPLSEWDWQCSRHERREHRCQVPSSEDNRKVYSGGGAGEEEDVLGVMPPTTLTLLSLHCLRQRASGCGGNGYPEKYSQSTRNKVAATLSMTYGYVKNRISITLVRDTHRCIGGSRVPAHKISLQRLQWEYGAGINLFR